MNIIGNFKYNNTDYILIYDNKYKIGKINNHKITYDFNDKEKLLILNIINKISISNYLIKLPNIKEYNVLYDYKKDIYVFDSITNKQDLCKLNNIFNNRDIYVYNKNNETNTFKRIIKIGSKIITLTLVSSLLLSQTNEVQIDIIRQLSSDKLIQVEDNLVLEDYNLDNVSEFDKLTIIYEDKTLDNIINTIKNNKYLTEEEKELFLSNRQIFIDNIDYFSDSLLLDLANLHITYVNEENDNPNVMGTYCYRDNTITIYKSSNLTSTDKTVLTHEFCHALQGDVTNSFLSEGLNSLVNSEYFSNDATYENEKKYVKALIELIGIEDIKKINFDYDINKLITKLNEIIADEELANKLITLINTIHFDGISTTLTVEEKSNYESEIKEIFAKYYEVKYQRNINTDLLMLYYLDEDLFKQSSIFKVNENMSEATLKYGINVVSEKTYFNSLNIKDYLVFSIDNIEEETKYFTESEARSNGIITTDDNGNDVINPLFSKDENNNYYRTLLVNTGQISLVTLNEDNRYINNLDRIK